ncbi:AAA family ATPase [Armatimonas sp.]|uniref:AAA family ATPase n=1 Tax=Armatimonas sp. TaxID=1872638 RepID=UPI0037536EC3
MHLTRLSVQGFRSLKDITWQPGKLNVVIGPNGSGKSNIIKLFDILCESAKGRLEDHVKNEGGAKALLWDGILENIITKLNIQYIKDVELEYLLNLKNPNRHHEASKFAIENECLKSDKILFSKLKTIGKLEIPNYETELSRFSIEKVNLTRFSALVYVRDISLFYNFDTSKNSSLRMPVLTEYEKKPSKNGENIVNVLHTLYSENREFKKIINDSMKAAFGDDFEELVFPPASDQRVQMRIRWKSLKREQSAADLSDGTLRFLFLLAVLANPEPAPLIAIDEPETGLHPTMMPLIAELAVEASKKTQVIFTTHSDQFLDAFRDTRPTTTVAKWEDGQTKLHIVDDDELKHFLKDYSLGALFRSGELESEFLARRQDGA